MTTEQKVKATVYATAKQISRDVLTNFNMEVEPEVLDIIAEMTYKKLVLYGSDLEAFQKHGKRSTINVDDVRILVRRNDSMKELIEHKLLAINASKPQDPAIGAKRKRNG